MKRLSYERWPALDRCAWEELLREGDILEGRGAGAHWAPATRSTNAHHYGIWLGWLDRQGDLARSVDHPADRVTPNRVRAYVSELLNSVAPKTADSVLRDLKVVIKVMAPDRNWRWLMDLSNRVKQFARPRAAKSLPRMSPQEMFRKIIATFESRYDYKPQETKANLEYRDTLMIGILLGAPIRRRNLAMMQVSEHLQFIDSAWHLRFAANEAKTHQPIHLVLPTRLSPYITFYLDTVRPSIAGIVPQDHFWLAQHGGPLRPDAIYQRIRFASERLFGEKINPHAFRSIAATLLAESSPEDALHARSLLGHRRAETTQTYYVQAKQIRSSRKVADAISDMRKSQGSYLKCRG
jgi:integrase